MDISNRALAVLLLATMVVSLGGTIVSMNRLGAISTTGMATEQGTVALEVAQLLSITLDVNSINFGECTPPSSGIYVINSEDGQNTSTSCSGGDTFPKPLIVRNDGTVNAAVNLTTNKVGQADGGGFLPSGAGTSYIEYRTINDSIGGNVAGCSGNLVGSYTRLNVTTSGFVACTNLTYGFESANSFGAHFQIGLPEGADQGSESATITFSAVEAE